MTAMTTLIPPLALSRTQVPQPEQVLPTYDARDLVQEGPQAHILLDGMTYVLRITKAGKLILTK